MDNNTPPVLEWNESHPARKLLYNEIWAGIIPIEACDMSPDEVYYMYALTLEFQTTGMSYGPTFVRRLRELQKQIKREQWAGKEDKNWCLPSGWNGSVAQALLQFDISQGKHKLMSPAELYKHREEYKVVGSSLWFHWKINQEMHRMNITKTETT